MSEVHAPRYGVVAAPTRWVSARLDALSAALALPCPVRDGFLFDADDAFYDALTRSVVSLQHATRRVIEHLGLRCDTVIVGFRSGVDFAGCIQREGGRWFVEIDARFEHDAQSLGAIIAHECCHILVESRGVPRFDSALDEVHVDLAAMLAGLGALTLNAIRRRVQITREHMMKRHDSFGYLEPALLQHAYAYVTARLGVGKRAALQHLYVADHRRGVWRRRLWIALVAALTRRGALSFGALPPQVVLPCRGRGCARRLRVPTDKRGVARCPECRAERKIDGRPLRALVVDGPQPLEAVALPAVRSR